jgi:hypothetical protein
MDHIKLYYDAWSKKTSKFYLRYVQYMVIMNHFKCMQSFELPYEVGCLGTISDVSLYWEIFFVFPSRIYEYVRFIFEMCHE